MLFSILAWLHIATAVVAIGGSVFVLFVLRPVAMRSLDPPAMQKLFPALQMRFRWVIWGAIVMFVVTGLWMATSFRGITTGAALTSSSYGRTLLVKSILALILFLLGLSITLPLKNLAWFRTRQLNIQRFIIGLAMVIVLLAAFMVRRGGIF